MICGLGGSGYRAHLGPGDVATRTIFQRGWLSNVTFFNPPELSNTDHRNTYQQLFSYHNQKCIETQGDESYGAFLERSLGRLSQRCHRALTEIAPNRSHGVMNLACREARAGDYHGKSAHREAASIG